MCSDVVYILGMFASMCGILDEQHVFVKHCWQGFHFSHIAHQVVLTCK